MGQWRQHAGLLSLAIWLVGCDHATKAIAQRTLGSGAVVHVVPGMLDLHYAENHDIGFALLQFVPDPLRWPLILLLGGLMIGGLGWLARRRRHGALIERAGLALLIAGGLGNFLDRAMRGFVVDFIHVLDWPTFNIADVCVLAGALCLGWAWRRGVPTRAGPDPTSSRSAPG